MLCSDECLGWRALEKLEPSIVLSDVTDSWNASSIAKTCPASNVHRVDQTQQFAIRSFKTRGV